jgi:hypothetical protein
VHWAPHIGHCVKQPRGPVRCHCWLAGMMLLQLFTSFDDKEVIGVSVASNSALTHSTALARHLNKQVMRHIGVYFQIECSLRSFVFEVFRMAYLKSGRVLREQLYHFLWGLPLH